MKTSHKTPVCNSALTIALAFWLTALLPAPAQNGADAPETVFPYVIQPELWAAEYAPGDGIVLITLRGNRPHLEPGGCYLLEGTYTLVSAESADLAWFATARQPSGSTPVSKDEHVKVSKSSNKFRLVKTLHDDGWLHVSFYVDGQPHGGVYFGEKGIEKTVLRKKDWSDFSKDLSSAKPNSRAAGESNGSTVVEPANRAILAYLGKPVAAPADLNPKYSPKSLEQALNTLSRKADLQMLRLAVDDSEFPFLVYGLLAGKHEYRVFENGLREMKDYTYGGSVVGTTDKEATYFSLNIIPYEQFPRDQTVPCNRRLMVRLQMLADAARQSE